MWTDPDDEPAKPDRWRPNPCNCRGCNVCGFYGLGAVPTSATPAAEPDAPEPPPAPRRRPRPAAAPTLFDGVAD